LEGSVGTHQLILRIKDPNFSIDDLAYYTLSLLVGRNDFQFCVTDTRENRCLWLEDYQFESTLSATELTDVLFKLFEGHHVLMAGFWKAVKLVIKNQKFTLLPSSVFSSDNLKNYLKMSTEVDEPTDDFFYYKHVQSDAVSVFAIESKIISHLQSIYPTLSIQVIHHGSALIEGIQRHKDYTHDRDMFLHLDHTHLSIVVTDNGEFIYYNRFSYQNAKDILKYVLMVMQELSLQQESTKVLIWGELTSNSDAFLELYHYIRNVSFGGKPAYLRFSFVFDEAVDHQYFDVYSIYACE
jgi:hypothetical protein